jgi:murein DD-endopeptidase MepM/ murein hydrolase activator NlpD
MNTKRIFIFLTLISMLAFGLWLPASAAPDLRQQIFTPTAGPDGRIIYIAQPGDNCTRIAGLNGITVDQLRQLNSKLDQNCTIVVGQEYLVGIISQEGTPTAGPSPTPAPATVTPTPFTGTTEICVLLFNDINGNSIREETEPAVAGGAISVTENNGEYSAAQETFIPDDPAAFQGFCFENVPEGSYNITVGIPDNYNPTMDLNSTLNVKAGDRAFVSFGVQSKDVVAGTGQQPENPGEQPRSPLLGILGAFFLLGGAGLGYYAWRSGKPESKLSGGSNILRK